MLKVRAAKCQDVRNNHRSKLREQNFARNSNLYKNETANDRSTLGPLTGRNARRYVAQDNLEMIWPSRREGCVPFRHTTLKFPS